MSLGINKYNKYLHFINPIIKAITVEFKVVGNDIVKHKWGSNTFYVILYRLQSRQTLPVQLALFYTVSEKSKQGGIQTEDTACGKAQMLAQYGIIITRELASH